MINKIHRLYIFLYTIYFYTVYNPIDNYFYMPNEILGKWEDIIGVPITIIVPNNFHISMLVSRDGDYYSPKTVRDYHKKYNLDNNRRDEVNQILYFVNDVMKNRLLWKQDIMKTIELFEKHIGKIEYIKSEPIDLYVLYYEHRNWLYQNPHARELKILELLNERQSM